MIQFIVKGEIDSVPEYFKLKKGHYIAEFESLDSEKRNELKKIYPQGYFRLAFWEKGGSDFDSGNADIVCGLKGEVLLPIRIRTKGWLANSYHALFVGNELCVIHAQLEQRNITLCLEKHSIKNKIGVENIETLWEGSRDDLATLPEDIKPFEEALNVAVKKVLEYRCTIPMYYEKLLT